MRRIGERFDTDDITFVGHSLGAGLATLASCTTGFPAMAYNPAALSYHTKQMNGAFYRPDVTNYISSTTIWKRNIIVDPLTWVQGGIRVLQTIRLPFLPYNICDLPGKIVKVPMKSSCSHGIDDMINALK